MFGIFAVQNTRELLADFFLDLLAPAFCSAADVLAFACSCRVAPSPPGWSFFFVRDLEISPAGRSSIAAQRDFYLSALASEYDLRAWHFAVLLSIALACSFGCGPSNVLCKRFEAF